MNKFNPLIPESFAEALGQTLIHSIWQVALLGLGLWLVLFLFPKASPAVRYRLGAITISLMLLIPSVTFFCVYEPGAASSKGISLKMIDGINSGDPVPALANSTIESLSDFIQQNAQLLSLLWLLGALIFAIRFIGGFARIHSLKTQGIRSAPVALYDSLESLMERMNIRRKVGLFESSRIRVPMVIGVLKPVILLPASLPDTLNTEQLEFILAHELAHVKRWDFLLNLFQSVVEILLFFHPAVWLTSRFLRTERENCCDEWVLRVKENNISYARALVHLEATRQQNSHLTLAANGGQFSKRIKKITGAQESQRNYSQGIAALALTFVLLAGLCLTTQDTAKATGISSGTGPGFFTAGMDWLAPVKDDPKEVGMSEAATRQLALETLSNMVVDTPRAKKVIFEDEGMEIVVGLGTNGIVNSVSVDGAAQPASEYYKYQELVDAELGSMNSSDQARSREETERMAWEARKQAEAARAMAEDARHHAEADRQRAMAERELDLSGGLEAFEIGMKALERSLEALGKTLGTSPLLSLDSLNNPQEWEEYGRRMEAWGRQFGDQFKAEWGEDGNEIEKSMQELGRQIEKDMEQSLKRLGKGLNSLELEKLGLELEMKAEAMARTLEEKYSMKEITHELKKDGLIRDSDRGYSLDIDQEEMKVNGKRVTRELHQKYLTLFGAKGIDVQNKVRIRIDNKDRKKDKNTIDL